MALDEVRLEEQVVLHLARRQVENAEEVTEADLLDVAELEPELLAGGAQVDDLRRLDRRRLEEHLTAARRHAHLAGDLGRGHGGGVDGHATHRHLRPAALRGAGGHEQQGGDPNEAHARLVTRRARGGKAAPSSGVG
ncbi:MAG: hypothetical protein U0802_12030 [Candidatus Binatia bacterium]